MAAALRAAMDDSGDQAARQWSLTDRLRRGLADIPGVDVHGHRTQRVPHLVCFSVPEVDAGVLTMALDDRGFRLAVGSNCSGSPDEPSSVLEHMGVPGRPSFRVGVGPQPRRGRGRCRDAAGAPGACDDRARRVPWGPQPRGAGYSTVRRRRANSFDAPDRAGRWRAELACIASPQTGRSTSRNAVQVGSVGPVAVCASANASDGRPCCRA
jgi:hypothetical protein